MGKLKMFRSSIVNLRLKGERYKMDKQKYKPKKFEDTSKNFRHVIWIIIVTGIVLIIWAISVYFASIA